VVSTQVIQETYVNLRRKVRNPLSAAQAKGIVEDYLSWELIVNDGASILQALEIEQRYQLSFWDALIVHAAERANAPVLLSEDLSHGQRYGATTAHNPFLP
jgi:predicted nucleic acid-binding protein